MAAEVSPEKIPKTHSQLVFPHSHAHAQWRTIAEEFSALLNPEFVDLVFLVRGRPGLLCAHRALVAAAWPALREDLRGLSQPPPLEMRAGGLAWLESTATTGREIAGGEVGASSGTTPPIGSPTSPGASPVLGQKGKQGKGRGDTFAKDSPTTAEAPEVIRSVDFPGVLDVSTQMWGSYALLRALLCHLYSRPVVIGERELPMLRVAALSLGNAELARCCDDADRWPNAARLAVSRPGTPELEGTRTTGPSGSTGALRGGGGPSPSPPPRLGTGSALSTREVTAGQPEAGTGRLSREVPASGRDSSFPGGQTEGSSGLAPGLPVLPPRAGTASLVVPGSESASRGAGGAAASGCQEISPKAAGAPGAPDGGPDAQWPVRVVSRSPANPGQSEGTEARSLLPQAVRQQSWCEKAGVGGGSADKSSQEKENAGVAPAAPSSGGVRRVLSEIKRNIVESSRIIADKTFQQMYEMVPGERGILGEGINGPVRMARHRKTGREVAVKRISCVNLSEQRRQMLVSEVRIFLQVSHRNIVQLLEVYESEVDQAVLLVMELCTGRELFERLADRRWYSEFDAARVARQMLDAVSYLHSQNICHRDLKLENWLYESPAHEAKLKLCDFGFGQIVEPSVQLTATLGSLFYVAPEVLAGSYGLPCDMWSVGVIVYMLLSGFPPFDGKTDADVMAKIRQGRFVSTGKRWEGISETAKHFVRSILRKDPYERLTAAEAAQHAWLKMECQAKPSSWPKGNTDAELELPIDRGVIRDMWKFAQNNAITRAALGMLAKLNTSSFGGCEEDVLLLEQRFRSHDEQSTGKIDAEAFIRALRETLHLQISSAEEKHFFDRIAGSLPLSEETGQGTALPEQRGRRRREVNYREFIALTKARRMANNTAAIREAFRAMDVAGDGYLKEHDMHNLLGDEFKATIENYVDVNGKDFIDYADFASIVSQEIAKKEASAGKDESVRKEETARKEERTRKEEGIRRELPPEQLDVQGPQQELAAVQPGHSRSGSQNLHEVEVEAVQPLEAAAAGTGGATVSATPVDAAGLPVNWVVEVTPGTGAMEPDGERLVGSGRGEAAALPSQGFGHLPQASEQREAQESPAPGLEGAFTAEGGRVATEADVRGLGGERYEEQEEDECDASTVSDEEQLVNVKNPEEAQVEREAEKPTPPAKDSKACFSLSLAGSSEYDDMGGVNRVISMPSDAYSIRQLPGFHSRTLRPFYAARPVSNVVMGLIFGTSLYAKQSVAARLATIIHTTCGWFFIMPNPKYHTEVDSRKGLLSKETGKFRFVAWWIHPRFVPQLRQWFERLTYEGLDQERQEQRREARAQHEARPQHHKGETKNPKAEVERVATTMPGGGDESGGEGDPVATVAVTATARKMEVQKPAPYPTEQEGPMPDAVKSGRTAYEELTTGKVDVASGIGSPGDFRFSDVPKPENYLHTYRDLHTREHVNMLHQLNDGTHRFLRSLFDEHFMAHATISAGFHYPVRTQYATLHMQLRVNSGSVCSEDGRGIEVNSLIETLKRDRLAYVRDEETLRYHVTENVKVSLLAAANEYEEQNPGESAKRHTTPLTFELGVTAMPTIHDEGEEEEESIEDGRGLSRKDSKMTRADFSAADAAAAAAGGDAAGDVPKAEAVCAGAAPSGNEREAAGAPASYLVNLQPSPDSRFWKVIYERRARCAEVFGTDPTYLYPLHVSVTGFFEAYPGQVERLVTAMRELLQKELEGVHGVTVGRVICTKTGYVLFDLHATAVTSYAQHLGERSSRELGVHIRPKAVNHISLACNRPEEEVRERIRAIYEPPDEEPGGAEIREACSTATFDLVLSRLIQRSSFERMAEDGPHKFFEVARLPLSPVTQSGGDFG